MKDVNNWYVEAKSEEEANEVVALALKLGAKLRDHVGGYKIQGRQYPWDMYGCWGVKNGKTATAGQCSQVFKLSEQVSLKELKDYVQDLMRKKPYPVGEEVTVIHADVNKGLCKVKYLGDTVGVYTNEKEEFCAYLKDIEYKDSKEEPPVEQELLDVILSIKTDALYVDVVESIIGGTWVHFRACYGDNLDHLVGNFVGYAVNLDDLPEIMTIEDQARGILEELVERLGKDLFIKEEIV